MDDRTGRGVLHNWKAGIVGFMSPPPTGYECIHVHISGLCLFPAYLMMFQLEGLAWLVKDALEKMVQQRSCRNSKQVRYPGICLERQKNQQKLGQ
jgi:hypothetical protein